MTTPAMPACLECNALLSPADTGGLCPKCLLKLGLASQLTAGRFSAGAEGLRPDGSVEAPFTFGDYRILRLLGKGGMGAVYEGEQIETGRRVALKVLGKSLDTPEMRQRFLREGQLAAAVRHAHVVSILGAEEIEETPVIVMELLHDGTLKNWVTQRGPLPVREAVDVILQIIDGLEAAHAAGVLHRDVKPGNCFASAEGVVKVGDFGLSISTLVKAEQSLTKSGTVLGTPAFAAPEQLRGEEIDARADIYAVGATLYFLLSGKPAFEGESLVALIAAVLEKKPADPRSLRPELPRTLAQIVMRCLEKERARRFRNYAALRAALIPYSSAATTPATLGLRFVAGVIDGLAVYFPFWIGQWFHLAWLEADWARDRTAASFAITALHGLWLLAWFAVPETLWGRSLGKWICGLRVVRADSGPIGWGAAFARTALYTFSEFVGTLLTVFFISAEAYRAGEISGWHDAIPILLFLTLWTTIRRSNGFAGLHDLLTRTRVVLDPLAGDETLDPESFVTEGLQAQGELVGPYQLIRREGSLAQAFDPVLRRPVWLEFHPPGTPVASPVRQGQSRVTRLRWLMGRRGAEENWDAFDHPDGRPLLALAGSRQPWGRVRVWLSDLAGELRVGVQEGSLPAQVSLGHIWLTRAGRAVLLDFPAPDTTPMPALPIGGAAQMQDFLSAAAELVVSPILPMAARQFLDGLRARRFEATPIVAGNLQALLGRPASVNRSRRALNIFLVPLIIALVAFVDLSADGKKFDEEWQRTHPGQSSPRIGLELLNDESATADAGLVKLAAHLATTHGQELVGDPFWETPSVQSLVERGDVGRFPATAMIAQALGQRERAAASGTPWRPSPEDEQAVTQMLRRETAKRGGWSPQLRICGMALLGCCVFAMLIVLLFRTPLTSRLLGIAAVRADGKRAGRLRMTWRSLVAVSPAFLIATLLVLHEKWFPDAALKPGWMLGGIVAGFGLVWLLSIAPRRAWEDRLAGTWLVPR